MGNCWKIQTQGSEEVIKVQYIFRSPNNVSYTLTFCIFIGLNNYNFDPATLAMDYRSVGFRECMTEVSRYLLTSEGLDIQDPLRLRMIGHLQCYSTQREVASKHASLNPTFQGGSWNSMSAHPSWNSQYSTNSMGAMGVHGGGQVDHTQLLSSSSISSGVHSSAGTDTSRVHPHMDNHMRLSSSGGGNGPAQLHSSCPTSQPLPQVHTQFPVSLSVNSVSMLSPSHNYTSNSFPLSHQAKHYRPWGAELAF